MKMTRGILIDAENRKVSEVRFNYTLAELYRLVGCNCITHVPMGELEIIVDDEGLLKEQNCFFKFDGVTLAGNGLVLGRGEDDFASTDATAEEIAGRVQFLYADQVPAEEREPHIEVLAFSNLEDFLKAMDAMREVR